MEILTAMSVFVRVVDCGSFSRAAESLGMSKSAVSKQVSRLEDHLGTRLLNRTTRRISLTEAGERVYDRSRRAVAEAEAVEVEIGAHRDTPSGTLRVSAGVSFGHRQLAPHLAGLLQRCPDLTVDLVLNDRAVDLVEEGYDVALRIGRLRDSSMIARRLAEIRVQTAAAPSYLERHGLPEVPADLRDHVCLGYSYLDSGSTWHFDGPAGPARHKFTPRLQANNGDALMAAAEAGLGVVHLPDFILADAFRTGSVVPLLAGFEPAPIGLYAIYPAGRPVAAKVRAFIDTMVAAFGDGNRRALGAG